ncbi:hypothetical protein O1C77_003563 [Vibrio cholerae]|uniref:hypothetical protein n=1 Tax=Vibrio cholerae TaxID=666 RepID=UPI00163C0C16|nr:hypothetical protein [Vibrio cholerae]EKF9659542.1 hypothetical protein [Vibrio cholerae]EKF9678322.1 hypothetical protein [Vibrio cholerae]HDB1440472.1 hypothetical protein [Vibrio cholerae]HDI3238739.1 hypothetical protein [Vibrio cholerae]
MFEDITKSIKANLYDRVSSPLFGAFAISWLLWNFKVVLVVFSSLTAIEKINYLEGTLVYSDTVDLILRGLLYPVFSSIAFLVLYPIPAKWAFGYWSRKQKELKVLKQEIEDETPLTLEESRRIRRDSVRLEIEFEEEIARKEEEIVRLKEVIQSLQSAEVSSSRKVEKEPSNTSIDFNAEQLSVISDIAQKGGTVRDDEFLSSTKLDVVKAKYYLEDLDAKGYLKRNYTRGAYYSELTTSGKKLAIEKGFVK